MRLDFKLESKSEITQLESIPGENKIYIGTSREIFSLEYENGIIRKIISSTQDIDQFSILTTKRLIYLTQDEFHICDMDGNESRKILLKNDKVLNASSFLLSSSKDKIVFVAEAAETAKDNEISTYRICLLDLENEKIIVLLKDQLSSMPKLIGWKDDSIVLPANELESLLLLSMDGMNEQILGLDFSSPLKDGEIESVAINQKGKVAFSVSYPIDRVQVFLKENWKNRLLFDSDGEGGAQNALAWAPNSQKLFYINSWFSSSSIFIISTDEMPEAVEASIISSESKVAWLPKSDGIVFTEGNTIHVLKNRQNASKTKASSI